MSSNLASPSPSTRSEATTEVDEEFIDRLTALKMAGLVLQPQIPDYLTRGPILEDSLRTPTSDVQDETVEDCLKYLLAGDKDATYNLNGIARLARDRHFRFLGSVLEHKFPGNFIGADASRPWFLYWCLSGLVLLGHDVGRWRDGVVATAGSMQNEDGGFGGGCGQMSHLACTYATLLALSLVGGEEAYEVVDRRAMWRWLNELKQADGGFQVCLGGEEDIRGAYCAAVIITLLKLPIDLSPESPAWDGEEGKTLFTDLAEYVKRCEFSPVFGLVDMVASADSAGQTFEGGMSGLPEAEAHGAYAFCALACLSMLDAPERIIPKYEKNRNTPITAYTNGENRYLDVPRLISWLSSRQYAPEGGFSGRTNKLVDGCYSHWVGGCWPLIEACLNGSTSGTSQSKHHNLAPAAASLFSREALIRYTYNCCQDFTKRGGLRDKPGK